MLNEIKFANNAINSPTWRATRLDYDWANEIEPHARFAIVNSGMESVQNIPRKIAHRSNAFIYERTASRVKDVFRHLVVSTLASNTSKIKQLEFAVDNMPKRVDAIIEKIKSGGLSYSDELLDLAQKAIDSNPSIKL